MNGDRRQVVVVQSGPPEPGLGQVKPQRFDQMQFATGGCRRPDGISRVRGDARGVEQQPEHLPIMTKIRALVCPGLTRAYRTARVRGLCSVTILVSWGLGCHTRRIASPLAPVCTRRVEIK